MALGPRQKALVDDLRSGKHKQITRKLASDNGFCCLGRACEVAISLGCKVDVFNHIYNDQVAIMPKEVVEFFKFHDSGGMSKIQGYMSLVFFNDRGYNFGQIADIIEDNADVYFDKVV